MDPRRLALAFGFALMVALGARGQTVAGAGSETLSALLAAQSEIRVYFPYSPKTTPGMGHQSATVHVMDRLMELGFRGEFLIVHDPGAEELLKTLLGGRHPIKDLIPNDHRSLRRRNAEEVLLGVTGGDDYRNFNRADQLEVALFLSLDPLDRPGMNRVWLRGERESRPLDELRTLPYHYRASDRRLDGRVIEEHRTRLDSEVPGKAELLADLVRAMAAGSIETLPFYDQREDRPRYLTQLARGLRQAVSADPASFRDLIVIPIFNEISPPEIDALRTTFETASRERGWRARLQGILRRPPEVHVELSTDGRLPAPRVGAKSVIFVPVGKVPRAVFEMIFATSSLPPAFNGRNTANLLLSTGRPFLMTPASFRDRAIEMTGQFGGPEARRKTQEAFRDLAREFPESSAGGLARFFLDLRSPDSSVAKAFAEAGRFVQDPAHDKITRGLELTLEGALRVSSPAPRRGRPGLRCEVIFL